MRTILNTATFLITITLLTACGNRVYNNKAFLNQNSLGNKTIAILPVEVLMTGKMPKNFTEEQKIKQQNRESRFYQDMLYSEFLDKASRKNKSKANVTFINPREINNKLQNTAFTSEGLKEKTYEELAKITAADMVLMVSIKKNRLLSDAAAIGIDVAESVLNSILRTDNTQNIATRTYDISIDATLVDGATGTVISKFSNIREANWRNNPEIEIRRNFRIVTRKFAVKAN